MAHRHGRAPRGQRLRCNMPHGHWKTTIVVGALRPTGMTAPRPGRAYERGLVPRLCHPAPEARRRRDHGQPRRPQERPGSGRHGGRRRVADVPAAPHSRHQPDQERLRQARKAVLRKAAARSIDLVWDASPASYRPTHPANAPTTSPPLEMMKTNGEML